MSQLVTVVCMTNVTHYKLVVNVTGLSKKTDISRDPFEFDDPEDIEIYVHTEDPLFCPRRYHMIYEELATGKVTETKSLEKKKMRITGSQLRSAIVLLDPRCCKRNNAYDICKLNGPTVDIKEFLTNPYIRMCKIWFHIPTCLCPFCKEENSHRRDGKPQQHYHRAVPEWMIWRHQMTMIALLLIVIEKVQQVLKEMDYYTSQGWIREGNRIWNQIKTNSMIEDLVAKIDPGGGPIKDGKKATVFWIYYMVPPWMDTSQKHTTGVSC